MDDLEDFDQDFDGDDDEDFIDEDDVYGLNDESSTDPYQDQTPCIDAFGDRSTVGFELLWRDLWREIRKPPLPYYKTHDIDPFNLVCLRCGRSERDIHWEKLRCESSPPPSSADRLRLADRQP